jgi:hypothetical protein
MNNPSTKKQLKIFFFAVFFCAPCPNPQMVMAQPFRLGFAKKTKLFALGASLAKMLGGLEKGEANCRYYG